MSQQARGQVPNNEFALGRRGPTRRCAVQKWHAGKQRFDMCLHRDLLVRLGARGKRRIESLAQIVRQLLEANRRLSNNISLAPTHIAYACGGSHLLRQPLSCLVVLPGKLHGAAPWIALICSGVRWNVIGSTVPVKATLSAARVKHSSDIALTNRDPWRLRPAPLCQVHPPWATERQMTSDWP